MDETTYRILDALTRNVGQALSIQDLTREIQRLHGSAYYANVYREVQALRGRGSVSVSPLGRASSVSLNFQSYPLIDLLTELEIRRKREVIQQVERAEATFAAVEGALRPLAVEFAVTSQTAANLRLNRLELLVGIRGSAGRRIEGAMAAVGEQLGVRVDALVISNGELIRFLGMEAQNPVGEMVGQGIVIHGPQSFWAVVAGAVVEGRRIAVTGPTDLARVPRGDLTYNLARFGYPLLGAAKGGGAFSVETCVVAALKSKDARIGRGAGALLEKQRFNARVLAFLASKFGVGADLLRRLDGVGPKPEVDELRGLLGGSRAGRTRPGATARGKPARNDDDAE